MKRIFTFFAVCLVFFGLHSPVSAESHGEPPVKDLEQQFYNLIVQETTQNNQVKNYDSKAALKQKLQSIMKAPIADYYLDKYFEEKNGKLYLIAMNGPHHLSFDHDYELKKINDHYYRAVQPLSKDYSKNCD